MLGAIFLISDQFTRAADGVVVLAPRNIGFDSIGSVVEIKEPLIEGLIYQFPITFKNSSKKSFRLTSATAICNCVSATFEKQQIGDGQEFGCKVFVRPKSSQMLQVIELKGSEGDANSESTLLKFKIDITVVSPLTLESQSVTIVNGVPNRKQISVKREDGIDDLNCEVSQQESPVIIRFDSDKLLVKQRESVTKEERSLGVTESATCYLNFTFKYKGETGKISRAIEISPPKSIRVTPSKLVFRRKDEVYHARCVLSNLESEVCQSDAIETLWLDSKRWTSIRNEFHVDKLSNSMLLCWISIPENLITEGVRNSQILRVKLNHGDPGPIDILVEFAD